MDNNNNSRGEDGGGNKKRKSDDISDDNNNSDSITSADTYTVYSLQKRKSWKRRKLSLIDVLNYMNLNTHLLVQIRIFYN